MNIILEIDRERTREACLIDIQNVFNTLNHELVSEVM